MSIASVFGLILAGGASSRLFPFNKVLSDLTGEGRSLLQQSYDRLQLPSKQVYALTVKEMVKPIRRQLRMPASHVLVDPVRRGTWPAILWAMAHLRRSSPESVLAIVTGDHVIQGKKAFQDALRKALKLAQSHPAFVMLGIPPGSDATEWRSFGCFRTEVDGRVAGFEEKPTIMRAQSMIQEGGWAWNSGMFFFRISTAERALDLFQPDMARVYRGIVKTIAAGKKHAAAFLFEDFADKIPHPVDPSRYVDNSIDFAIMTPLVARGGGDLSAYAVPRPSFSWIDLGQWDALRKVTKADRHGNFKVGAVQIGPETAGCILAADRGMTLRCAGTKRLIVAFSDKTALVLAEEKLPQIKDYVAEARKHPDRLVVEHETARCQIQAQGARVIAAGVSGLDIEVRGKRCVVSAKSGFIR